ncbi:MAG: S-adenosylmethionine:tRNA ribosyltransferase-isomerase [Ignavibacteria bacterium]
MKSILKPQQIRIKDFTYDLPDERIARYPLKERDESKLLIYKDGIISEDAYKNIDKYLPADSLLIFNDTKVIHARLIFRNSKDEKIEIFCLEPAEENSEPVTSMARKKSVKWKCMIGRMNKWKEKTLELKTNELSLCAEIIEKKIDSYVIEFKWHPEELTFSEVIESIGEMPIPPYLKRVSEEIDDLRYQTVYARNDGSVAAPTAGLHFSNNILNNLKSKKIETDYVTLHVGAGTFKPVKSETLEDHEMHSEWIDVKKETIENILEQLLRSYSDRIDKGIITAVGTTSLRTLESLYWMGVKANQDPDSQLHEIEIKQWDPYEINTKLSAADSLKKLLIWMERNNLDRLICRTQIIIVPSYKLKIVEVLITNFHQPDSTLLLLVAAVTGNDWKDIYKYALENKFRFLSYGDGSLIFKNDAGNSE